MYIGVNTNEQILYTIYNITHSHNTTNTQHNIPGWEGFAKVNACLLSVLFLSVFSFFTGMLFLDASMRSNVDASWDHVMQFPCTCLAVGANTLAVFRFDPICIIWCVNSIYSIYIYILYICIYSRLYSTYLYS